MSLSSSSTNTSNASPSLAPSTILESRSVIRELSQLQLQASAGGNLLQPPASKPPRRKRIGRLQPNGQPKLFGGSLEEYLEATNQEIPLIIKSCIRVINLYGKPASNFVRCFLATWRLEISIVKSIRSVSHIWTFFYIFFTILDQFSSRNPVVPSEI